MKTVEYHQKVPQFKFSPNCFMLENDSIILFENYSENFQPANLSIDESEKVILTISAKDLIFDPQSSLHRHKTTGEMYFFDRKKKLYYPVHRTYFLCYLFIRTYIILTEKRKLMDLMSFKIPFLLILKPILV